MSNPECLARRVPCFLGHAAAGALPWRSNGVGVESLRHTKEAKK